VYFQIMLALSRLSTSYNTKCSVINRTSLHLSELSEVLQGGFATVSN